MEWSTSQLSLAFRQGQLVLVLFLELFRGEWDRHGHCARCVANAECGPDLDRPWLRVRDKEDVADRSVKLFVRNHVRADGGGSSSRLPSVVALCLLTLGAVPVPMRTSTEAAFHVAAQPLTLRSLAFLAWSVPSGVAAFAVLTQLRCCWRIRPRAQLFCNKGASLWFVELYVATHFPRFEVT
eukprot:820657-Pleurochrysis_carterae.AAC.3